MIKKLIVELTQEDVVKYLGDDINRAVEIAVKGETIERAIEKMLEQKLRQKLDWYYQQNEFSIIRIIKELLLKNSDLHILFKKYIKETLKRETTKLEKEIERLKAGE